MNAPHLLVDVRNALYRAIYAVKSDRRHEVKHHYFVALLRQMSNWINVHRPEAVHVFWDAPRATVWRRKVSATYKDRTVSQYVEDISEDLARTTEVAKAFFQHMNVRQYERREMEADDLIYAAVSVLHPKNTVIVSTDSDMIQIPYTFNSSAVYHPRDASIVAVPEINPVWQKALVGDDSDSIAGYRGIGPKKSATILSGHNALQDFLGTVDKQVFYRNLLLIDLSANPRLLANKIYFQSNYCKPTQFDDTKINELIKQYHVNGMLSEYADIIPHFKALK